jgi:hypothetical protein
MSAGCAVTALIEAAMTAWPFKDRPPLEIGVEDGIVWATVPSPLGPINGYALIPAEGHPWSAGVPLINNERGWEEYESERTLEVHGGITYGASGPWIGFDCLHAFDVWPPEFDLLGVRLRTDSRGRLWTPELVAEEARNLARQIAAIS